MNDLTVGISSDDPSVTLGTAGEPNPGEQDTVSGRARALSSRLLARGRRRALGGRCSPATPSPDSG